MRKIEKLINWLRKPFERYKTKKLAKTAEKQLQIAFQKELIGRQELRKSVNNFLYEFFGINAKSKYIPHDFKNKEEVKVAVIEKFSEPMARLSLSYEDLFK